MVHGKDSTHVQNFPSLIRACHNYVDSTWFPQLTPVTPWEFTQRFYIYTHQRASLWNGYNLICPVQILHIFIQTLYFTNMNFKEYRITQTNWCHAGEVLIQGTQTKLLIQSNLKTKAKHALYNNISFNNYIHLHQNPFQ